WSGWAIRQSRQRRSWGSAPRRCGGGSIGRAGPYASGSEGTMHDVRDVLGVVVGTVEPRKPDIEAVLGRASAHRRRQRLLAGALALVLTTGLATGLLIALTRGGPAVPAAGGSIVGPTRVVLIPSTSMEPTLHPGDQVLVDEGAYKGELPGRGDVIAFTI